MGNIVLAKKLRQKNPHPDLDLRVSSNSSGCSSGGGKCSGFKCPVTKNPLRVSCGLAGCKYHIDFVWSKNCLLQYITHHEIDRLSPEEISYLYNIPLPEVQTTLDDTMKVMRSMTLEASRLESSDYCPEFGYVRSDRVCVVCESLILDESERIYIAGAQGLVYCSPECQEELPPEVVTMQQRYGLPVEKVLKWALQSFKKPALAAQALELTLAKFKRLCMSYIKIDIGKYYSDEEDSQGVYDKVHSFLAAAAREYGHSNLNFDGVTAEIAAM